ncbi:Hsp70 family protein [Paractinoplanes rhizophilus]|uniref:Hsp70 family protein n=1 Tax=Paractinoplanes rhizophilus TaxID=1416877 RepID=A0ABW2HSJ4_9ACTN
MTQHTSYHPGTSYHPVVGIDLGTTSCTMSVWNGREPVVVPGPLRSVVAQNDAGQIVVGREPERDAQPVIAGVKRELGSDERVRLRGRQYRPPEICAFLLIELKRRAEAFLGGPVHDAVITVSGSAGEPQRRAIREAAGLAQLNVRRLLDDPVAAAVALGPDDRERTYAIYDLGGGTFETAIVRINAEGVAVLGGAGDPRLGGDDFDERIVGYALRQIRERHHVDLSRDDHVRARIRREAERRKRELSTAEQAVLELPSLTATVSAGVPLSRRGFEAMIEPEVTKSLGHLTAALANARAEHGIGRDGVDQVVLSGCSTRVPAVRDRLCGYFGLGAGDIRTDLDPGHLNAIGAGLIAREFEPAVAFEGSRPGLLGANLRLRAEMADPSPAAPSTSAAGPPDLLPGVPAETPADFRPVADATHLLLVRDGARPALRAAYLSFVAAIQAAAPDARLAELGDLLTAEFARLR